MKKKILITFGIIIGVIVLGFAILIGYFVATDLKEESILKNEISELNILLNAEKLESKKIDKILDRTKTKKDYAVVEKAYKQYIKDIYSNVVELKNILDDDKLTSSLTVKNYLEDGPEFKNTKEYLSTTKSKINKSKDKYYALLDEGNAMSYIKVTTLDDYYIELYQNEIIDSITTARKDNTLKNSLDYLIAILDLEEQVIDFLSTYKDMWIIENNNIVFDTEDLLNKYNEYLNKIEQKEIPKNNSSNMAV